MDHRLNLLYRTIALALFALTGGLAAGVPLLDAHETPGQAGIEETHDSRCSYQHDHDLCIVFQQSPAEAAPASALASVGSPTLRTPTRLARPVAVRQLHTQQLARAPPALS